MSVEQLNSLLDQLHLTLEPSLPPQILLFLNQLPSSSGNHHEGRMRMIAAAAVRAEVELVPSVGGRGKVKYGVTLQQFLQHVQSTEKESFLQAVEYVLGDWKQAPQSLTAKFREIKRTYAIFKHYRTLFYTLSSQVSLTDAVAYNLMSAFWIVYLQTKNTFHIHNQQGEEAELALLDELVGYAFRKIGGGLGQEHIRSAFNREFKKQAPVAQQINKIYEQQFEEILNSAYRIRYDNDIEIGLKTLAKDQCLLLRFVDDFSNKFSHRNGYQSDQINQLSYLQLDKSITPQSMVKRIPNQHQINKVLDFDGIDPEEPNDHHPHPIPSNTHNSYEIEEEVENHSCEKHNDSSGNSNSRSHSQESEIDPSAEIFKHFRVEEEEEGYGEMQKRRKKLVINKCQTRISILKWVQDEIHNAEKKLPSDALLEEMAQIMEDVQRYQQQSTEKLMLVLEQVCSQCKDKLHRSVQIYKLFISFLQKMRSGIKKEDFQNIASNQHYLNAFLCLTTVIFNYAYKTRQLSFQQYCLFFGVNILTGFVPLNWLGANADLPKQLQLFLFQLEERILFEELWKTSTGIELFSNKGSFSFVQMAMKKRLFKHINHRIVLLCKNDINDKEKTSLFKFIEDILTCRQHLFKDNNLYVIVICSILYLYGKVITIDKIIDSLRKNEKVVKITLEAKDHMGFPISIEQFYKDIFLHEMQPLFTSRKQQLYLTPTKLTPMTAIKHSYTGQKSPIVIQKYRFGEDSLSKNNSGVGVYRKSLAEKIFKEPCQAYPKSSSDDEDE